MVDIGNLKWTVFAQF